MPKVSVILPVYQADGFLARTLRSLFGQTLEDMEYIIVDDASTDRSMAIVDAILSHYPERRSQVVILTHRYNTGVGTARHDGLLRATGDYVIHCDADDWLEPEAYQLMYETAVRTDADMVICDFVVEHNNRKSMSRHEQANRSDTRLLDDILTRRAHAAVWNKMIRRSFIERHSIDFTRGLRVCEDLMFCLRALIYNPRISYLHQPLYHYDRSINPNPLSHKRKTYDAGQIRIWLDALDNLPCTSDSTLYINELTHIAYWTLRHRTLTRSQYRSLFRPHITKFLKSVQPLYIRLSTTLGALGLLPPRQYS